jgi:hypothetical protein
LSAHSSITHAARCLAAVQALIQRQSGGPAALGWPPCDSLLGSDCGVRVAGFPFRGDAHSTAATRRTPRRARCEMWAHMRQPTTADALTFHTVGECGDGVALADRETNDHIPLQGVATVELAGVADRGLATAAGREEIDSDNNE